jgi:Domain of unknown function (DUF4177)
MKRYEFKVVTIDRTEVRTPESKELAKLNDLGNEGWRVVVVRDDPQHNRDIILLMERERD